MARQKGNVKEAERAVDPTVPLARPEGESAAECMRVGQLLVDGGHLTAENLALGLSQANGDLLTFIDLVVSRFSTERHIAAMAVSQVTGVPAAETKGVVVPDHLKSVLDEAVVRRHLAIAVAEDGASLVVLCVDPSPRRRAEIDRAAGRPVKYMLADPATVRTFIDSMYRADADIDRS